MISLKCIWQTISLAQCAYNLMDQALCGGLYPGPGRDLWNVQIAGVLLAPFSSGGF